MQQLIIQEGLPLPMRVGANPTSEAAQIASGLQWDIERHLPDTHLTELHPVIPHTEGHMVIQAVSAIQGRELEGLSAHPPEAEVSDLTVAVLEAEDSREGEVEDFQEEAVGAFPVEGAGVGVDEVKK